MLDELIILLRSESYKPLLKGLRRRAERGIPFTGTLKLADLSEVERKAIADLTGHKPRGRNMLIRLDSLDRLVRNTERFGSLLQLVEAALGGPIENRRAKTDQHAADWGELWQWGASRAKDDAVRLRWIDHLRRSGWLKARSRRDHLVARRLLEASLDLLDQLPANGIPLPIFAAMYLNDSHALDSDRDLGRLVCRGIAAMKGLLPPTKRSDVRRLWESVGIVPDELSVTVLSLNIPAIGDSLSDRVLRAHAAVGEPCRISFRQLRLYAPTIEPTENDVLFVCENPSVVASAAERLGPKCRPLICVEGQPNFAVCRLLTFAISAGWRLAYHGDFDCGGIRIANRIFDQFGFAPWRFDTLSYQHYSGKRRKLQSIPPQARWDATLSSAISSDGHVLEEEQVIEQLLVDLRKPV